MAVNPRSEFASIQGSYTLHSIVEDENYDMISPMDSTRMRGWGSLESRKSYKCLASLAVDDQTSSLLNKEVAASSPRSLKSQEGIIQSRRCDTRNVESWGYFVDTLNSNY
jgi:hypothetical protein